MERPIFLSREITYNLDLILFQPRRITSLIEIYFEGYPTISLPYISFH